MVGRIFMFILGIWMACRFIWILHSCDKIKAKLIKAVPGYDEYEYVYMEKKITSTAFAPIFLKGNKTEFPIWVNKTKHYKIYSRNEMLFWSIMGFGLIISGIFLLIIDIVY